MIGGEIIVTVMEISGNIARLGIDAPRGVSIYREEIWLAVEAENRAAAAAGVDALPLRSVGETTTQQPGESASEPVAEANAGSGADAPKTAS